MVNFVKKIANATKNAVTAHRVQEQMTACHKLNPTFDNEQCEDFLLTAANQGRLAVGGGKRKSYRKKCSKKRKSYRKKSKRKSKKRKSSKRRR